MTYDPPQAPVVTRPAEGQAYGVTAAPIETLPLEAQLVDAMRDLAVFDQSDGTVGADTRPVIKTEVSAWASSPS